MTSLQDRVGRLEGAVEHMATKADLERSTAELRQLLHAAAAAVATNEVAIAELAKDMAEVKADVAQLKADVAQLKADVAQLKADVAGLKAEFADMREVLAKILEILMNQKPPLGFTPAGDR